MAARAGATARAHFCKIDGCEGARSGRWRRCCCGVFRGQFLHAAGAHATLFEQRVSAGSPSQVTAQHAVLRFCFAREQDQAPVCVAQVVFRNMKRVS